MSGYGGFIHRSETADFVWSTKEFCIIRATMGFVADDNFTANWKKVGQIKKLIYSSPVVSDEVKVYANASKLVESIQVLQGWYGQTWRENPLVVAITNPLIDLMWVSTFVSYFRDTGVLKPADPKMLLYTTKKKWDSILINTAEGEAKLVQILNQAEVFVSDYDNSQPALPNKIGKVHWREYSPGKVEYSESGVFQTPGYLFVQGGTPDPNNPPTPSGNTMPVIHTCPKCGQKLSW